MKSTSYITAAVCLGSVLAFTAFAQENPGSPTTPGQGSTMGGATTTQQQTRGDLRASKAIGSEVKTAQGEKLGKIEEFILNPASGRVDFAVLDWNNKLVPVPFSLLTVSRTGGRTGFLAPTGSEYSFTAKVDMSKLQNAPTINKNQWNDISQPGWSEKIYSHYGVSPEGMGAPGSENQKPGMDTGSGGLDQDQHKESGAGGTGTSPDTGTK